MLNVLHLRLNPKVYYDYAAPRRICAKCSGFTVRGVFILILKALVNKRRGIVSTMMMNETCSAIQNKNGKEKTLKESV